MVYADPNTTTRSVPANVITLIGTTVYVLQNTVFLICLLVYIYRIDHLFLLIWSSLYTSVAIMYGRRCGARLSHSDARLRSGSALTAHS